MAGEAQVKEQYLVSINGKEVKECNEIKVDANDNLPNNAKQGEAIKTVNEDDENAESMEPPQNKKRKGRNKARPRTVPKVKEEFRLCPAISNNIVCKFGDKCKFLHDVEGYMKTKPADLGTECINYRLTGKCRYGAECRFAKEHLTDKYENIINEEKYRIHCERMGNDNTLTKELIYILRKKQYKFPKTELYLEKVSQANGHGEGSVTKTTGAFTDEDVIPLNSREKKKIDFSNKLYLAPLTTVGNLPFRRICKRLGADITCGEMAMATNLLQCHQAEWALVKRHPSEDIFGVQLCGGFPDTMSKAAELLSQECNLDFIDINMGCPIDLVFKKGEGSALMARLNKLQTIIKGMVEVSDVPITIKMRTGIHENKSTAHKVVPLVKEWGVDLITLHGRSREQRYTRAADWDYINECAQLSDPIPFYGNGDILSFEDANLRRETTGISGLMIARGALIKPWIFTEIKEQRHWDISSQERLELLQDFTVFGLEHWGSDHKGVENTRRFLLEWLSFLHRYIPVGLLKEVPQKVNHRPPAYFGRDDLETLLASRNARDWVKISEMLLGPVPDNFIFLPKHKANAYN